MAGRNWDQDQYGREQHGRGDFNAYRGGRVRETGRDYERFGDRFGDRLSERLSDRDRGEYGRDMAARDDEREFGDRDFGWRDMGRRERGGRGIGGREFGAREFGGREDRGYGGYGREASRGDYERGRFDESGTRYYDEMRGGYRGDGSGYEAGTGFGTAGRSYGADMERSDRYDYSSQGYMQPGEFAGRGPKGYQRSDERIREDVCEILTRHPGIDASDIEVAVQSREVTLRGQVPERRMKRLAEDVVEGLSGVQDVHNEIKVTQGSLMQKMADAIGVGEGREQKETSRSSKSSSATQSSRT